MCGRFACTLAPGNVVRACTYRDKEGVEHEPKWHDASDGGTYYPSSNIPPTSYTPVLYLENPEDERQIQPMMWGLVPFWHTGTDPKSHGLSTHNARIERIQESRLYKTYLEQRCIVVCDGFYEWQAHGSARKQPYFVYAHQKKDHEIDEVLDYSRDPDSYINEGEWKGPKLLYLAGLYSVWRDDDDKTVYSYTIITRDSGKALGWLHSRAPAILATEHSRRKWLDPSVLPQEALKLLGPVKEKDLEWHAVSTDVGNVKNQELDLIKEVKPMPSDEKKKSGASSSKATKNLMSNWLSQSPSSSKKATSSSDDVKPDPDTSKVVKKESEDIKDEKDDIKIENEDKETEKSKVEDEPTTKKPKVEMYEEDIPIFDQDLLDEYTTHIDNEEIGEIDEDDEEESECQ